MESDPVNSMISPAKNSVSPPSRKKQKMLSDKNGDLSKSHLSLEESSNASKEAPANSIIKFAVQCAEDECLKWRLVPEKKKYEQIRERIREDSFVCEKAREWQPDVSCDDPSDLSEQDNSTIWAIDKPDIPETPEGWERLITIRPEGSTQFADVFYKPPTGRMLRSLNDIKNYLAEHPDVAEAELSQFSFKMPTPLQKDYVIKRSLKSQSDVSHTGASDLLQPKEVHGDAKDNNEVKLEVVQSDELPEEPMTKSDSLPPAPAV